MNGDAPAALDLSVHYPLLQMLIYFDWIKLEDVANATARPPAQSTPTTALSMTRKPGYTKRCAPAACAALTWPSLGTTATQDAAARAHHEAVRMFLAEADGGLAGPERRGGRGGCVCALQRAGQRGLRRAALLAPGGQRLAGVAVLPRRSGRTLR